MKILGFKSCSFIKDFKKVLEFKIASVDKDLLLVWGSWIPAREANPPIVEELDSSDSLLSEIKISDDYSGVSATDKINPITNPIGIKI